MKGLAVTARALWWRARLTETKSRKSIRMKAYPPIRRARAEWKKRDIRVKSPRRTLKERQSRSAKSLPFIYVW